MPESRCAQWFKRAPAALFSLAVPCVPLTALAQEGLAGLRPAGIDLVQQTDSGVAGEVAPPVVARAQPLPLRLSSELSPLKPLPGGGLKLGAALRRPLNWRQLEARQQEEWQQEARLQLQHSVRVQEDGWHDVLLIDRAGPLALQFSTDMMGDVPGGPAAAGVGPQEDYRLVAFRATDGLRAEETQLWPVVGGASNYVLHGADGTGAQDKAEVQFLVPTRLVFSGLAYTDYRSYVSSNTETATSRNSGMNARLATHGYLWQPWFALVTGQLGVNLAKRTDNRVAADARDYGLTGSGALSFFPVSFFPFEAGFERSTSESLGISSTRNELSRFSFSQQLRPPGAESSYGANFNRSIARNFSGVTAEIERRSIFDNYGLAVSQQLLGTRFNLNGTYSRQLNEAYAGQPEQIADTVNLTLNNLYTFDEFSSLQSDAGYSASSFTQAGTTLSETKFFQMGSNYNWRAEDIPLSGSLAFRGSALNVTAEGRVFQSSSTSVNSGINYQLSAKTSLFVTGTANRSTTNSNQTLSAGGTYQGDNRVIKGFSHTWSANARTSYAGGAGAGSSISTTMAGSQTLGRSWQDVVPGILYLNANQNISADSIGTSDAGLSIAHGGGVTWTLSRQRLQLSVSANASDSRRLATDSSSSQLLGLQAGGSLDMGKSSRISASLNSQAMRQGSGNRQGEFVVTAGGTVTYNTSRFMGIRQLLLASALRGDLVPERDRQTASVPVAPINLSWDNQLTYRLGRTNFQAQLQAQSVAGVNSGLVYFRVERQLGF